MIFGLKIRIRPVFNIILSTCYYHCIIHYRSQGFKDPDPPWYLFLPVGSGSLIIIYVRPLIQDFHKNQVRIRIPIDELDPDHYVKLWGSATLLCNVQHRQKDNSGDSNWIPGLQPVCMKAFKYCFIYIYIYIYIYTFISFLHFKQSLNPPQLIS